MNAVGEESIIIPLISFAAQVSTASMLAPFMAVRHSSIEHARCNIRAEDKQLLRRPMATYSALPNLCALAVMQLEPQAFHCVCGRQTVHTPPKVWGAELSAHPRRHQHNHLQLGNAATGSSMVPTCGPHVLHVAGLAISRPFQHGSQNLPAKFHCDAGQSWVRQCLHVAYNGFHEGFIQ